MRAIALKPLTIEGQRIEIGQYIDVTDWRPHLRSLLTRNDRIALLPETPAEGLVVLTDEEGNRFLAPSMTLQPLPDVTPEEPAQKPAAKPRSSRSRN